MKQTLLWKFFGNIEVSGVLNVNLSNIIVHGNIIASNTGEINLMPSQLLIVYGNITIGSNLQLWAFPTPLL